MVTTASAVFPFRLSPLNNIQPFTYRDGMSHLQLLEKLRVYVNDNLRHEFNAEMERIIAEFNAGMLEQETAFNTAFNDFLTLITDEVNAINNRVGPEGVQHETLTENYALDIDPVWPTNQHLMFDLIQDGTGGRTVTFQGEPVPVDPAPNARTVFTIVPLHDGTWRVQENSYQDKLTADEIVATYETKQHAADTFETKQHATDTYTTKTAAAALYPTKATVIQGKYPERRGGNLAGVTVAFLGDSYASGVGPSAPDKKWTSLYAARANFVESNHAVSSAGWVNQGVTGSGKTANQAANIPLNTSRVIICAGINDPSFSDSQITQGVTETIGAIRTRVPSAEIIVIAPMWWNAQPSDGVRRVERLIRNTLPGDVRFVEGAMWLRQSRSDMQTSDGHPNDLGSLLISRWVEAKIDNTGPGGALEGAFERTSLFADAQGVSDESVASSSSVGLCGGTIYDAMPGKWRLTFELTAYGTSDGYVWIEPANGHPVAQRWGINTAGIYPVTYQYGIDVRHPGGDFVIEGGMQMNAPINVLTPGTRIKADWIMD